MKFTALAAAAALFGASTVSASAAGHGHQDVARQAMHRRGADRIQRLTKRAQTAALLAVQNSTSTSTDALSTTAIWWAEDGWTGSCGVKIDNNANTVGLPLSLYPNADAQSSLCGQTAYAVNPSTGESVSVVVVDGSDRSDYATFSKAAYLALGGNLDTGMLPITLSLSPAAAKAAVVDAASAASSAATVSASAKSATSSAASVRSSTSSVSSVAAPTTKATTTEAPTTTAAPTTTTQDQVALAAAASSSKAFEHQQSLQLAAQASSSSQAAAAYAASQAAASQAAASQAAASQAAAASAAAAAEASQAAASQAAQQAAAAAAASKASADAAWASSSSAAAAAKPTQDSSSSSGGGQVYSGGIATFFYQNGVAGNCGNVNSDNTLLVALPTATYAGGSHCGQYVEITRSDTGNKIKALVADSCPTCNNNSCLDLSWGAFSALGGTQSMGVFDITWQFV